MSIQSSAPVILDHQLNAIARASEGGVCAGCAANLRATDARHYCVEIVQAIHQTHIGTYDDGRRYAICLCGWKGGSRANREQAHNDRIEHYNFMLHVAQQAGGPR